MRRVVVALLVVGLVVAGVAWGLRGERPAQQVLASTVVDTGTVAVRIDRFEQVWEIPGALRRIPPQWMRRYPVLVGAWVRLFREPIPTGMVWYVVEATVASDEPLQPEDLNFRLDYGTYTLGSKGMGIRAEAGRPYVIDTSFEVTDGPVPKALKIQVKGEWLRFPIDVR